MGLFKKPDLFERRANACENLSKYERKYDDTLKEKYKDKMNKYQGEIDGIDKYLSNTGPRTKITNSNHSNTLNITTNKSQNIASNNQFGFHKPKKSGK